ncbi:MAG: polysaccharide biosynthesis/export family protein [Terriglobia bacterium]
MSRSSFVQHACVTTPWTKVLFFLVGVTGLVLLSACVSPRALRPQVPVDPPVVQTAMRFRKEYVLAPGDQVEVVVRRVGELSRVVGVRPDGNISLPLLDDVPAAGLTPRELDARLTELLAGRLVEPDVTVIANQIRQPVVYVVGDVLRPSPLPIRDAPTAMQAIALAGGLARSAARRDITIIRLSEDGFLRAIPITVEDEGQPGPFLAAGSNLLQPDDLVFVPESGRSQFARFLDDFVTRPLSVVGQALGVYANFRLIQVLNN